MKLLTRTTGEVVTTKRSRLCYRQQVPSSSAPAASPGLGAVAKQAVITFLRDASMTTAEREATRRAPQCWRPGLASRGVYRIEG